MAEKWIIEYSYASGIPNSKWSKWEPIYEEVYTDWNRIKLHGNAPMNPRPLNEILNSLAEFMQKNEVKTAGSRLSYRARKVGSDETIPCEIFI